MTDFDLDNLDKMDFDAVEKDLKAKTDEREAVEKANIEALREGADSCDGGGCIL